MEPQFATSPPFPKRFSSWASDSQGLSAKQPSSNGKQPKTLDMECIPTVKLRKIRTGKHRRRESRHLTSSSSPQDRGHFSLCYFQDNKVILMGGDNTDHEYSDVWELSLQKRGWVKRMELTDPLTGHQSLNLGVVLKDNVVKEDSRRLFTYGGWQLNKYNEAIYMLDMATMQLKKCPRSVPKLKMDEHKGAKTMIDPKKKIELEKSIPEGRRDHTMLYHSELNAVIMIGGWNALEWSPHKVELEIWLYRSDWKWRRAIWKMPQAIPLNRRGHTAVYDEATNSIYVFGGIFGYSKVLGDFHKIHIGDDLMVTSTEIKKKSSWDHFPTARAWHTSTLVGRHIYMVGGLKGITETLGELLVYNIDQGYWIRVYQNELLLDRCAHSAIEYSGSIVLLGGYRYSKSAELDCESLDQSGGGSTSRPGSFLAQESKPTYISLSEIAVIDTKPTSDLPELKWVSTFPWDKAFKRSKSSDDVNNRVTQAKRISTKDKGHGRLEWNITIFPSDQMTHQMDAFSNTQRSGFLQNSVSSTKQPEVSIDPFADLKDTD